jgi:DMSO reductase anchor subunit
LSEDLCPVCLAPLTSKRSGYGTDLLVCLKCGYQVEKSQIKPIHRTEQTALAKETEMGWEPSLTFFTVILQFTVGAYIATLFVNYLALDLKEFSSTPLSTLWVASLAGLLISIGHGKNPRSFLFILTSIRSSYLGREVILLGLFTLLLILYPLRSLILPEHTINIIHDYVSLVTGVLGIAAMVGIYVVPARPCWRHSYTPFSFVVPAATSGPIFVLLLLGAASNRIIQTTPFGVTVAVLVTSLSVVDIITYRKYRAYLAIQGDETRACLEKLNARKTTYKLKITLRLLTASLSVASLPLSTSLSLDLWLTYTTLCLALTLSADIISRGLFYLSVGAPLGEERFLKVAKDLAG